MFDLKTLTGDPFDAWLYILWCVLVGENNCHRDNMMKYLYLLYIAWSSIILTLHKLYFLWCTAHMEFCFHVEQEQLFFCIVCAVWFLTGMSWSKHWWICSGVNKLQWMFAEQSANPFFLLDFQRKFKSVKRECSTIDDKSTNEKTSKIRVCCIKMSEGVHSHDSEHDLSLLFVEKWHRYGDQQIRPIRFPNRYSASRRIETSQESGRLPN